MSSHIKDKTRSVLFVTEYYPPLIFGGGEINIQKIARGLARRNIHVTILTSSVQGMPLHREEDGVTVLRMISNASTVDGLTSFLRFFLFPRGLHAWWRQYEEFLARMDLIHFFGSTYRFAHLLKKKSIWVYMFESLIPLCPKGDFLYKGETICSGCGIEKFRACIRSSPSIGRIPNMFFFKHNSFFLHKLYRTYEQGQENLSLFDAFTFPSDFIRKTSRLIAPSVIIPNILFETTPPVRDITLDKDRPVDILYAGAFTHFKGVDLLIQLAKRTSYKMLFIGDGPLQNAIHSLQQKYPNRIRLIQRQPSEKLPQFYRQAKITLVPSRVPETFGRVPYEALASGSIPLVSDRGALGEYMAYLDPSLIIPPHLRSIEQRVKELLTSHKPHTLVKENVSAFFKRVSEDVVIPALISLYNDLIERIYNERASSKSGVYNRPV